MRSSKERKDIHRGRALSKTFEEGIAGLLRQGRKLGGTPAFAEEADESTSCTALEMGILDVVEYGELEHTRSAAGALAATTATGSPLATGDSLVLGEFKEGMEEAVHHLLDDAGLDLVIEGIQAEVSGGAHDVEGGIEVISAVGEDEGSGVDETEGEMKGRRGKGGRWKVQSQGLARGRLRAPLNELGVEVGGAGNENEAVGGKDGSRAFMVDGGEGACERDADVRVEA